MKAQCLPFNQIPHSTKFFVDFLSWAPSVRRFYSRPPQFTDWMKDEASKLRYDSARRGQVASALERQNKSWGASAKTLENIARLRAGACTAVTGQQVGLFGGPAFSIYKALTAVKLAEEATKNGIDCIPVFWLATQDHDLAEISHVSIPGPDASLRKLTVPPQGHPDAPVGTIAFGEEIVPVVEAAVGLLGDSEETALLRECYRPGETFGSAFAKLFARWFADQGVILLDASDPEMNALAVPIYKSAVERAAELEQALLDRDKELESAGYHQQVKVTTSSTLLFVLHDGARLPIHRSSTKSDEFVIGREGISQAELLRQIASSPQNFSANVLLRPVVQDHLLPTLVYTGGAAEVAYFAQAAVVYEALLGRITPIIPRFSATLVDAKPNSLMERYGVSLPDLFQGPEAVRGKLAAHSLPAELQSAFNQAANSLKTSITQISSSLSRLDKTLVDAANNAGSKMQYQLDQLWGRAEKAELRQTEVLGRHAELLSNSLYPDKTLQERELAGIYFLSRHGTGFLRDIYSEIRLDCLNHQVISL